MDLWLRFPFLSNCDQSTKGSCDWTLSNTDRPRSLVTCTPLICLGVFDYHLGTGCTTGTPSQALLVSRSWSRDGTTSLTHSAPMLLHLDGAGLGNLLGVDFNDPASFFKALGGDAGTNLPIPDLMSPEDVRRVAKERTTNIFASHKTLHEMLLRHEATIHKRWTKRNRQQRLNSPSRSFGRTCQRLIAQTSKLSPRRLRHSVTWVLHTGPVSSGLTSTERIS